MKLRLLCGELGKFERNGLDVGEDTPWKRKAKLVNRE
jgi:hypothetical protein